MVQAMSAAPCAGNDRRNNMAGAALPHFDQILSKWAETVLRCHCRANPTKRFQPGSAQKNEIDPT